MPGIEKDLTEIIEPNKLFISLVPDSLNDKITKKEIYDYNH